MDSKRIGLRSLRSGALTLGLVFLVQGASAGTEMSVETRELEKGEEQVGRGLALLDGERLRIDSEVGERSFVYRADRGVVWVVDHTKRSYTEFRPPPIVDLSRELDKRLEGLPAEARGAVEKVLDAVSESEESDVAVRKTGASERILDIACTEFEVVRAGERLADACQSSYAAAGVDPASFAALRQLQELLQGRLGGMLAGSLGGEGIAALRSFGFVEGVPLRARTYRGGRLESQALATRIEQKDLPRSAFELPEGYSPSLTIDIRDHIGGP